MVETVHGKSSLVVDILNYTLFNRISKKGVVKNDLLINENKEDCGSSIEIKIKNEKHYIARATHVYAKTGKKAGEPVLQGKTDVDYKVIHLDGQEENRNGEQRDITDANIRKVFGSPDDFLLTSIAPQWQLLGFLDAGGSERLRLIGRYFDIDLFEKKYKLAKEDCKDIKTKIKFIEDKKLEETLAKNCDKLKVIQNSIREYKEKKEIIQKEINEAIQLLDKKEKQKDTFTDKSISLKLSKSSVVGTIDAINKKIQETLTYPCTKNVNCCLLQEVEKQKNKLTDYTERLKNIEEEITTNALQLEEFNKLHALSEDEKQYQLLESQQDAVFEKLFELNKQEGILKAQIEQAEKDIKEYIDLKLQYGIYDYFLLANSKDGISRQIISRNLDIINQEIKKILSDTVNFDIELVSEDDGKAVEIYFTHQRGKRRKAEICSGAEKTIMAIAIRAALVSISNLPRSNIFVIDEPSYLDADNLVAFSKILGYLKNLFSSVIIVTHLDILKDCVDHSIVIERNAEGYSQIVE